MEGKRGTGREPGENPRLLAEGLTNSSHVRSDVRYQDSNPVAQTTEPPKLIALAKCKLPLCKWYIKREYIRDYVPSYFIPCVDNAHQLSVILKRDIRVQVFVSTIFVFDANFVQRVPVNACVGSTSFTAHLVLYRPRNITSRRCLPPPWFESNRSSLGCSREINYTFRFVHFCKISKKTLRNPLSQFSKH